LRIVDESEVIDRHGRTRAVIRWDGVTGELRSVVRLDWSSDANRPRVDRSAAAAHARRQAGLAGLVAPRDAPSVAWDEAMDAWRVSWARLLDGYMAPGDGLTVWNSGTGANQGDGGKDEKRRLDLFCASLDPKGLEMFERRALKQGWRQIAVELGYASAHSAEVQFRKKADRAAARIRAKHG
jgi:hypothetical protein